MKLLLKTSYPCLIKTNTISVLLEENDMLEIDNEKEIFIYPENNLDIPFYINTSHPKESERVSIIKRNNQTILFLEESKKLNVFQKESLNFSGKICNISLSNNILCFENDSKKISYHLPHFYKNYKVFKVNNFACVQFEKDLYVFSTTKNKLTHFCGDEITLNENELSITKKIHDSMGREKRSTFKLEEEITLKQEDFMYNNGPQRNRNLLGYKFLESIKAKDFSFAFECLSTKLKNQIDKTQLQDFFGSIKNFLPVSSTEFITLSHSQKNFVTFSILNDKIEDVLIDNL